MLRACGNGDAAGGRPAAGLGGGGGGLGGERGIDNARSRFQGGGSGAHYIEWSRPEPNRHASAYRAQR